MVACTTTGNLGDVLSNALDKPACATVMDGDIAMYPLPNGAKLWTSGVTKKNEP